MKLRYFSLALITILLGINSWGLNRNANATFSIQITYGLTIFCLSAICFSFALQSLKGIGAIKIFAYLSPLILTQTIINGDALSTLIIFSIDVITLGILLLSITSDKLTRDIGVANERYFLLQTPSLIAATTAIVWSFFWTAIFFLIHNVRESNWLITGGLLIITLILLVIFTQSTIHLTQRRIVVVPNGIVLSDSITLTDTVLLPLSKLKDLKTIGRKKKLPPMDNEYLANSNSKNVTEITLTQKTDSFIVRKNHMSTERKDVDTLFVSLVRPVLFEKYFRNRFHQAGDHSEPSKAELIKMEKELKIETAPKSDAKLPEWRKKK